MHSRLIVFLACLNLVLAQASDSPVINTPPSVVQCLPSMLTYHGGTPPYTISIIPASQVGAPPLAELGQRNDDKMTWVTNFPAGTGITFQIRDSDGKINYSQAVTVQPSSNSDCLKPGSGPTTPPSTAPPPVVTGTGTVGGTPPAPAPTPGLNNSGSTPRPPNSTVSPPTSNTSTSNAGSSNNQTKGSSPFVPTTATNTPSPAATNAPNSAASSDTAVYHRSVLAGLAITGTVLALFV